MSGAGMDADFAVIRGGFRLQLQLNVPAGVVSAVVGPNGAGKSTALRTMAGLLRPHSGRISTSGRVLDDTESGVHIPPAQRGIGVVFQDYLLFPHLTALDNVAFGPMALGVPRRQAEARARDWLERLGISDLASARPGVLSGGQAQRVALARALVLEPSLLLLDEPLAALDASTRMEVRAELATQLRAFGGAIVLVTHDPIDALALGDELVVLEHGVVVQRGTPTEVARAPGSEYVADLLGLNRFTTDDGRHLVFSPADVALTSHRPESPANFLEECVVLGVEQVSGRVRVRLSTLANRARVTAELDVVDLASLPALGKRVWAGVADAKLHLA